jgi:hypothetical protein
MPKKTDVDFKMTGLSGITPTGFTVTYQVGEIPTAQLDFVPGTVDSQRLKVTINDSRSFIKNVEKNKRLNDVEINIKIKTNINNGQTKNHSLKFIGLLDGLSITNSVGNNTYSAVLKNKAQTLLELCIMTPGLYPASINIYKNPSFACVVKKGGEENQRKDGWTQLFGQGKINWERQPIEVYTDMIKELIKVQKSGWREYLGTDKTVSGKDIMESVFNDRRYQKALTRAEEFMNSIDIKAVTSSKNVKTLGWDKCTDSVQAMFAMGPNVLLENYLFFLNQMGVTLIFGNKKIWAVPINSMIRQELTPPGPQQLQTKPNRAYPADYVSYTYNDAGYRDICSVIVRTPEMVAGQYMGGLSFERGYSIDYTDEHEISQASGVLVIESHPWMKPHATGASSNQVPQTRGKADKAKAPMQDGPKDYSGSKEAAKSKAKQEQQKKDSVFKDELNAVLKNYAETKLYQARFADRTGSIVMDFNTEWVPGTSGLLWIHETQLWLQFYVVSVTHKVEVAPTANGTAITIVNYRCGRIGDNPAAVDEDKYLGFSKELEDKVREAWIGDTT